MNANPTILRMLQNLPDGYGKDPHAISGITLDGTGYASIEGNTLWVSTPTSSTGISLGASTASNVASVMPSGVVATVLQNGASELLLMDGPSTLPATVQIATSPLWMLLATLARMKENRRRSLLSQVAQLNVRIATGEWADWWGAAVGVDRLAGEPDPLYVLRLVGMTLEPNVNNVAMEQLLDSLGYSSSVTDTTPGTFQVSAAFPANPPYGYLYTQAQITEIIDRIKAAGTQAVLDWLAAVTDAMTLSDSVSVTTDGLATADTSLAGECTSA